MPAPSDFGDGATIIEGPMPSTAHVHAHSPGSSRGKGVEPSSPAKNYSTFAKTPDYLSEDRPFVVLIDKKGVLGALQELDGHLRTVRGFLFFLSLTLRLRCSQLYESLISISFAWVLQAGYNKIISDKVRDCSDGGPVLA
jgi:hypothetical protein